MEDRKNHFTSKCISCRSHRHGVNIINWLEESRINALLEVGINYFELNKKGLDSTLIFTQ